MIQSTQENWQWSVYEYHRTWEGANTPEGFLVNQLAFNGLYAIAAAARYFQLRDTLPFHPIAMHRIAEIALICDEPVSIEDRLNTINELADNAAEIAEEYGAQHQRPVSAMSKFLMLRFPVDSFVIDGNAKRVLARGILPPANQVPLGRLNDLNIFINRWEAYAHPMIGCLAGIAGGICEGNPAGAARIVDKFLWLKGSDRPNRTIPQDAPEIDCQRAIDAGTQIWEQLCGQELTAPPEDAQR